MRASSLAEGGLRYISIKLKPAPGEPSQYAYEDPVRSLNHSHRLEESFLLILLDFTFLSKRSYYLFVIHEFNQVENIITQIEVKTGNFSNRKKLQTSLLHFNLYMASRNDETKLLLILICTFPTNGEVKLLNTHRGKKKKDKRKKPTCA